MDTDHGSAAMTTASESTHAKSHAARAGGRSARVALLLFALLLVLAYSLPGLIGHDPWNRTEMASTEIVQTMLESGDLVVPRLGAEPAVEQPPLYAMTAAGFARLLTDRLPLHDAARLATGLYLLITLGFTALIGRAAWGREASGGAIAVLVLLGTLGLLQGGHFLGSEIAVAAGVAMALYGLVAAPARPFWGGIWLGIGVGVAFMSDGLLGPAIIGVSALLLPLFSSWRSGRYLRALLVAIVVSLPWLLIWPVALHLRDPALFDLWFWGNTIERSIGSLDFSAPASWGFWLRTAPWVTFPAALLAVLALVLRPRAAFTSAGVQASLVLTLVGWAALIFSPSAHQLDALPLLAPLAVVAAGSVARLPGWIIKPVYWLSVLSFGLAALVLWGLWIWIMQTGHPPELEVIARHLPMDYRFQWHPIAYGAAAVFTIVWLWMVMRFRPPRAMALMAWPLGVALLWGLAALLHLPWVDAGNSWRGVFSEMQAALPAGHGCVADVREPETVRLRETERSMARYVAGINSKQTGSIEQTDCDLLLLQVQRRQHPDGFDPGANWRLLWQGQRPTDERYQFMLFERM
jgi:4-amino-4-deoxy-L-arabinose transferase-like glycosyltransferase